MKNKIVCLSLVLCMATMLAACGKANAPSEESGTSLTEKSVEEETDDSEIEDKADAEKENSQENEDSKTGDAKEEKDTDPQKNENSENGNPEIEDVETEDKEDSQENKISESENTEEGETSGGNIKFEELNLGDVIKTDFLEMTIDGASEAQELLPTDTSSVYSYYSDKDGETYFYLTGTMKNLGGEAYDVEDMYAEFCFDDKYTYNASLAADDGGNDFYGSYVEPLNSVKYYLYSSIPDELINTYTTCLIRFGFHDNFEYDYTTDFSEYKNRYEITVTK